MAVSAVPITPAKLDMASSILAAFERGTAPVDWCERNYVVTPHIAEFFNTVSNLPFLLMPPLMSLLYRRYASIEGNGSHLVFFLIFVGSTYYHATLSLAGQLMDEIGILWVITAGVIMWWPCTRIPAWCNVNRRMRFSLPLATAVFLVTCISVVFPALNAIVLMTLSIPTVTILTIVELKRCNEPTLTRLGYRTLALCLTAVTIWALDRLFCDFWLYLNFPYLHSLWHVLICVASCQFCTLFAYLSVHARNPETLPVLKQWPNERWGDLGVAYVDIKSPFRKSPLEV